MTQENIITILNEYSPLVRRIAYSTCRSSNVLDLSDLYQVGEMAVLRAIREYDPTAGMSLKSFITRLVRQDIYNEAARFLGIFTVDHRTTKLASKIHKMHLNGKSDKEIACQLSASGSREFAVDYIRDLRIAYTRRHYAEVEDNTVDTPTLEESTIKDIFNSVLADDVEKLIWNKRIMGNASAIEVAEELNLTVARVYEIERHLKVRIQKAIQEIN